MSLNHQFKQAKKIIRGLNSDNLKSLKKICCEIQAAEIRLQKKIAEFDDSMYPKMQGNLLQKCAVGFDHQPLGFCFYSDNETFP